MEQVGKFGESGGDTCPFFGFGNNENHFDKNDNAYKVFQNEMIETEIECDSPTSSEWKSIKLLCQQDVDCKECQIFHNGVPSMSFL